MSVFEELIDDDRIDDLRVRSVMYCGSARARGSFAFEEEYD